MPLRNFGRVVLQQGAVLYRGGIASLTL